MFVQRGEHGLLLPQLGVQIARVAPGTAGGTLTLQPDATAGIDALVIESLADNNYATLSVFELHEFTGERERGLLKFDVSSIAGQTVVSAVLSLWNTALYGANYAISLQSILAANSGWTEAGATWNYAVASTTRWAGDTGNNGGADAGCSVSGTDFNATLLGTLNYAQAAANTEHQVTLVTSQVQSWVDGSNYGIYIRVQDDFTDSVNWHTSDSATAGFRPKLVIEYS